jgi:hypothetical protein
MGSENVWRFRNVSLTRDETLEKEAMPFVSRFCTVYDNGNLNDV